MQTSSPLLVYQQLIDVDASTSHNIQQNINGVC